MAKRSSRMPINGQDSPLKDDGHKLFSRFLSKERHNPPKQGESSFRVLYYGGATSSVPFMWESQPGTPKHALSGGNPSPPLTPPPYYQSSPRANPSPRKTGSKNSKILKSIFPKNHRKKINASPLFSPHSSSSSSSSFSSSCSLPSTPVHARPNNNNNNNDNNNNNIKARSRSSVQLGVEEGDEYEPGKYSPTSTLCFGYRNRSPSRKSKGYYYYPIKSVKKVVLSIVGHGSSF
ncbi:hypothetical protein OROGR_022685 [Orobanche gracilis]